MITITLCGAIKSGRQSVMCKLFKIRFNVNALLLLVYGILCSLAVSAFTVVATVIVPNNSVSDDLVNFLSYVLFPLDAILIVIMVIWVSLEPKEDDMMDALCPSFWKKEFHRAVMHSNWAKIYAYASEFSKIFKKYAYFYICTDTFHDLTLDQLERAMNILAEKTPEYFTEKLIETVLSDAENGSKNTYLVYFNSEETLKIKKWKRKTKQLS